MMSTTGGTAHPRADAPRVYLAGPEVFLPDATRIGAEKCRLATEAGFEGVFPLDTALELDGLPPAEQARRIALANEALMRSCDFVIANLTPFRGVSMDAGTAFEVGFMRALGRPVFGYTNAVADFATRSRHYREGRRLAFDSDRADIAVEDFGLAENLMIAVAISESGAAPIVPPGAATGDVTIAALDGFVAALAAARRLFALT